MTVVSGEVFDVAVDVRVGSPTFGAWTGENLSADNNHQLYIPGGFAHGFLVLSPDAVVVYKTSDYYDPHTEGVIRWNDPDLAIRWPIEPTSLSDRDRNARMLSELEKSTLPQL